MDLADKVDQIIKLIERGYINKEEGMCLLWGWDLSYEEYIKVKKTNLFKAMNQFEE